MRNERAGKWPHGLLDFCAGTDQESPETNNSYMAISKKQPTTAPLRHTGNIVWIYSSGGEDRSVLTQARLRSDREIAIDCQCDGNKYTMVLRSNDGIDFSGECRGSCDGETWLPVVNFKRWTNQKGLLLFGKWIEDGYESYCAIELFPE